MEKEALIIKTLSPENSDSLLNIKKKSSIIQTLNFSSVELCIVNINNLFLSNGGKQQSFFK